MDHDLRAVLALQFFQRQIQMQLTGPAQHHFLRVGISREAQGRIFLDQLVQSQTHLIDVGTRLGFDRKRQHRFGQSRPRIDDGMRLVA